MVEDEEELAKLIAQHLEDAGMQTQVYYRCAHAFRFLKHNFANLMLLDLTLPDQSGFALMEELKKNDISVPTIFLTGNTLEVSKVKALGDGRRRLHHEAVRLWGTHRAHPRRSAARRIAHGFQHHQECPDH